MTKVTFLVTNIYKCGGVQRVVSIIANRLSSLNKYQISIISVFKTDNQPYFDLNDRIIVKNLYSEPFDVRKGFIKILKKLRRIINNDEIDVLIFSGMGYGSIVKLATLGNKNIKVIGWEHQSFSFGKKFGLEWIGKRLAAKYMDAIVVLTKDDYLSYKLGIKKINNIKQIYNPINGEVLAAGYNSYSKCIISCGSLVPQKGFDMAVDIAKKVFEKYPDWQWHNYGDGEDREIIESKILKNNLQDNFILKGYCENINDKYKDYSMYVMTSRHEGFPMVLIEAKANKLPIVSFDCKCGPNEIVNNNINGYLVSCFDNDEMSNKIIKLIENEEKRKTFSLNSSIGLEKLQIEKIIIEWDKLICSEI